MLRAWGGRGRGDRRCWPFQRTAPPPALGRVTQFLRRRLPAPVRTMKVLATLLLCVATAVARLELASDTPTTINTKLEEQSFLHAELAIATRSMPTRRRGLRPKRC